MNIPFKDQVKFQHNNSQSDWWVKAETQIRAEDPWLEEQVDRYKDSEQFKKDLDNAKKAYSNRSRIRTLSPEIIGSIESNLLSSYKAKLNRDRTNKEIAEEEALKNPKFISMANAYSLLNTVGNLFSSLNIIQKNTEKMTKKFSVVDGKVLESLDKASQSLDNLQSKLQETKRLTKKPSKTATEQLIHGIFILCKIATIATMTVLASSSIAYVGIVLALIGGIKIGEIAYEKTKKKQGGIEDRDMHLIKASLNAAKILALAIGMVCFTNISMTIGLGVALYFCIEIVENIYCAFNASANLHDKTLQELRDSKLGLQSTLHDFGGAVLQSLNPFAGKES